MRKANQFQGGLCYCRILPELTGSPEGGTEKLGHRNRTKLNDLMKTQTVLEHASVSHNSIAAAFALLLHS